MLSTQQKQFFDQNGYLIIDDVFDSKTLLDPVKAEYSALLDRLVADWIDAGRVPAHLAGKDFFEKLLVCYEAGCDWFQPMDISLPGDEITQDTPMHFGPAVFNLLTAPKLLDIVEQLIGPEITSNPIQHVRLKPPARTLYEDEVRAHISHTDWHQDRGVTHDEADQTDMVTIWCAITDATVENGCLQVIPKSHIHALLPHCPKRQTAIADGFVNQSQALPVPVKSGGIVILHPLTAHASLENKTENFRWSFDIRFNQTGQPTGRSHFPEFIARSKKAPDTVLTDWRIWKANWEEARDRLANAEHIPIHRWTSQAPFCA
jgi:phytanoyl-CoA hydroxylase